MLIYAGAAKDMLFYIKQKPISQIILLTGYGMEYDFTLLNRELKCCFERGILMYCKCIDDVFLARNNKQIRELMTHFKIVDYVVSTGNVVVINCHLDYDLCYELDRRLIGICPTVSKSKFIKENK